MSVSKEEIESKMAATQALSQPIIFDAQAGDLSTKLNPDLAIKILALHAQAYAAYFGTPPKSNDPTTPESSTS